MLGFIFALLGVLLIGTAAASSTADPESAFSLPPSQWHALQDLYSSTGGDHWQYTLSANYSGYPWNFSVDSTGQPLHNPCSLEYPWVGVTCSSPCGLTPCDVIAVELFDFGLDGTLPPSIGALSALTNFSLIRNPSLVGTIPSELALLNRTLQTIFLDDTSVEGTLPSWVCELHQLTQITLINSNFSGSIPPCLSSLPHLQILQLTKSKLDGSIPDTFGAFPSLRLLRLFGSRLTGSLPTFFTNVSTLEFLDLSYNHLTSTIPAVLGDHPRLHLLFLAGNKLSGPIPSSLCNIKDFQFLNLARNSLTSSIPECIYALSKLRTLELFFNPITGTISPSIGNLTDVIFLSYYDMMLTGTIPPSIGNLTRIGFLGWNRNMLSSTLPATIGRLTNLVDVGFAYCMLTGTLPPVLFHLKKMIGLYADGNYFTGTLPDNMNNASRLGVIVMDENLFTGSLPSIMCLLTKNLSAISLPSNYLTGTVPSCFSRYESIVHFNLHQNFFHGPIPDDFSNLKKMELFDVSDNMFTGRIDRFFAGMRYLYVVNLYSNFFTGPIPVLTNASMLVALYLHQNALTGSIPSSLFEEAPKLFFFTATLNCLDGTIPASICKASKLRQLELAGLHSSPHCKNSDSFTSYFFKDTGVSGALPGCIFSLPKLSTFHIAGNRLSGTVSDVERPSPLLADISLSSNSFTGRIPPFLWNGSIAKLDLSFDRFRDAIPSNYVSQNKANNSLVLRRNRLSGDLPPSVLDMQNVDILAGNMFSCSSEWESDSSLPSHDPQAGTYSCGSSSFDVSMVMFMCAAGILGIAVYFVGRKRARSWQHWLATFQSQFDNGSLPSHIENFHSTFKRALAKREVVFLLLAALLFFLLVYYLLSSSYGTFINQYVWVVSAAYLDGLIPFLVITFIYACIVWHLLNQYYKSRRFLRKYPSQEQEKEEEEEEGEEREEKEVKEDNKEVEKETQRYFFEEWKWEAIAQLFFLAVNFIAVMGVNIAYVLSESTPDLSLGVKFLIVCAAAVFKFFWTDLFVLGVDVGLADSSLIRLSIFNNVFSPFLAEMMVSPNCFQFLFWDSPLQTTSIRIVECEAEAFCFVDNCFLLEICTITTLESLSTYVLSFVPPFVYSFQCSSSLISTFAVVFVYRYLLSAVIRPVFCLMLEWFKERYGHRYRKLLDVCDQGLSPLWRVDSFTTVETSPSLLELNRVRQRLIINIFVDLAVLCTFGLAIPLVGLLVVFSFAIQLLLFYLSIGRLYSLKELNEAVLQRVLLHLNSAFEHWANNLPKKILLLIFSTSIFWAYFLFDVMGGKFDPFVTMSVVFLLFVLPLVVARIITIFDNNDITRTKSSVLEGVQMRSIATFVSNPVLNAAEPPL